MLEFFKSKKTLGIGALCLVVLLGLFLVLQSQPTMTNLSDKGTQYLKELENQFIASPYYIEDNKVYIDDDKVYLSAEPHTGLGWINYTLTPKTYTGEIDIVFLFDTSSIFPRGVQYYKEGGWNNETISYTCEGDFEYTTDPKYFKCYKNITDGVTYEIEKRLVFEHYFESGNLESKTASWSETVYWKDISDIFTKQSFNFQGMNTGYVAKGINVTAEETYKIRVRLLSYNIPLKRYKYWFALKPSSETIQEAIANEHFYALDPWVDYPSLSEGLVSYYTFDSPDTDPSFIYDALFRYNFSIQTAVTNDYGGLINQSTYFTTNAGFGRVALAGSKWAMGSTAFSICAWINETTGGESYFLGNRDTSAPNSGYRFGQIVDKGAFLLDTGATSGASDSATQVTGSSFKFMCGIWNTTHIMINVNGNAFEDIVAVTGTVASAETYVIMGYDPQGTNAKDWEGNIDELSFFNRSLNITETEWLYNSGAGLQYTIITDSFPNITQHYPIDEQNFTTPSPITLNCTAFDDKNLMNVSFWVNDSIEFTNSSPINNTVVNYDDTYTNNYYSWLCQACDNATVSQCTNSSARQFRVNVTTGVTTTLISPASASKFNVSFANLVYNSTPLNVNLTNVTLSLWFNNGTLRSSNETSLSGNTTIQTTTNITSIIEENYIWNARTCGTGGVSCTFGANRTFEVDLTAPNLTIEDPANDSISTGVAEEGVSTTNITLNWTVTEAGRNLTAHITNCTYSLDGGGNTDITSVCIDPNYTTVANITGGNHNISMTIRDEFNFTDTEFTDFEVRLLTFSTSQDKLTVAEGSQVTFTLTLNYSTTIPASSGFVILNGTQYNPTSTTTTGDSYVFTVEAPIPEGFGNITGQVLDWAWNFTTAGLVDNTQTTTKNVTVFAVAFDDCSTFTKLIYNFTLYDEESAEVFNATNITSSNMEIDVTLISLFNSSITFDYSNSTNESSLPVCIPTGILNDTSFRMDVVGEYSTTNAVVEFYYVDNETLNDTNPNPIVSLYDLLLADSTTFLFTYTDEDNLEVPNAIVRTYRNYIGEGIFREVERGKEDDNGDTHLHLVEEDVIYFFEVTLNNEIIFTSSQYHAKCLTDPCQIGLSAVTSSGDTQSSFDNLPEGSYSLSSNKSTREVTLTFNLDTSAQMNLTVFRYTNIPDQDDVIINSSSVTASSGSMDVFIPQSFGNITYYALISKNNEPVTSEFVDFSQSPRDFFDDALAIFLSFLIIITLGLASSTEGVWSIIMIILGFILTGFLKLLDVDYVAIVFITLLGLLIIYKLVSRQRT